MPERPEHLELSARPELPRLHFPSIRLRARERDGQVEVWDALRGTYLVLTPEEWVRRHLVEFLISDCAASLRSIVEEYPVGINSTAQRADVVVLARELSLEQIGRISREIARNGITGPKGEPVRIEMFAHGALCMSVSGKCYLSEHEEGCSANRGACRQICRRKYTITDMQSGRELAVDGRYVLSPKDLCTIDFLDRFIAAGVRVLRSRGARAARST